MDEETAYEVLEILLGMLNTFARRARRAMFASYVRALASRRCVMFPEDAYNLGWHRLRALRCTIHASSVWILQLNLEVWFER